MKFIRSFVVVLAVVIVSAACVVVVVVPRSTNSAFRPSGIGKSSTDISSWDYGGTSSPVSDT